MRTLLSPVVDFGYFAATLRVMNRTKMRSERVRKSQFTTKCCETFEAHGTQIELLARDSLLLCGNELSRKEINMPTLAELQKRSVPFGRSKEQPRNQETLISDSRSRVTASEFIDRKLRIALDRSASCVRDLNGESRPIS